MYAKDLSEAKYEFLIEKHEDAGIKHLKDSNAFIECSSTMDDVYKNIDDYNPTTTRKILIVFDDIIAGIMSNKKFQAVVKELLMRCRKLHISLVFITQSLSFCSKRCQIKFNSLFDYENYQQKRITQYCNNTFGGY